MLINPNRLPDCTGNRTSATFETLMKKNGELENKILHLEDQITALENQLVEYEQFKDLIRSFVR